MKPSGIIRRILGTYALFVLITGVTTFAQNLSSPVRVWSVGPLTKSQLVGDVELGSKGAKLTPTHVDSQTGSIFKATRSVVFAGDRVVIAIDQSHTEQQFLLLSIDARTGEVKDSREFSKFGLRAIFATEDGQVVVSGSTVLRLNPDLKDDGSFDFLATGHKYCSAKEVSPDGSTIGVSTSPGFKLLSTRTLQTRDLTPAPAVGTSVNDFGFVTDNVRWFSDYPKDRYFATYVDAAGSHLLYHGKCGGRPQFLTNDLILEPGCGEHPLILDVHGNIVQTLSVKGGFSYAGVSQNGKRFALQITSSSGSSSDIHERFVIYSIDTWQPIAEIKPDELAEEQSWTAFSADGSMFVVGSPEKLTLYRLP